MKTLNILHLGFGNVGSKVMVQISRQKERIKQDFGVSLEYRNTFTSKNSKEEIFAAIQNVQLPFVLIDTTASDQTIPYITAVLKRNGFVVLANKKPLADTQKTFDRLHQLGEQRLLYECVVGAGLPVIQTLKNLLMTGDDIIEIQGCFSGTLGFIFSALDKGKLFSEAVNQAQKKGFTEPDPREDLSGNDVARKAIILARLLGQKKELGNVDLIGLCPPEIQDFSELDTLYKEKVMRAKEKKKVLRFVAKVTPQTCEVGLQEVNVAGDIGSLQGPDNIIIFKTKRYDKHPLVIKGPGAGIEVTAAGVFADVLSVARNI